MVAASFALMVACALVAVVAWAVGVRAYVRALAALGRGGGAGAVLVALVAWPLATDRIRDRGLAEAATVNKALVVVLAAVALGCAAAALYANFSFLQSR